MVYINKTKGVCSTQGVLKRPLKRTTVNQIITKTKVSRYPNNSRGSTTISDNHTQTRLY